MLNIYIYIYVFLLYIYIHTYPNAAIGAKCQNNRVPCRFVQCSESVRVHSCFWWTAAWDLVALPGLDDEDHEGPNGPNGPLPLQPHMVPTPQQTHHRRAPSSSSSDLAPAVPANRETAPAAVAAPMGHIFDDGATLWMIASSTGTRPQSNSFLEAVSPSASKQSAPIWKVASLLSALLMDFYVCWLYTRIKPSVRLANICDLALHGVFFIDVFGKDDILRMMKSFILWKKYVWHVWPNDWMTRWVTEWDDSPTDWLNDKMRD